MAIVTFKAEEMEETQWEPESWDRRSPITFGRKMTISSHMWSNIRYQDAISSHDLSGGRYQNLSDELAIAYWD